MAVTKIGKIETLGNYFVGQAGIVIFDKPANLETAKPSTLQNARAIGNIHMDSTTFTGEAATIDGLRNEQGIVYHYLASGGSFGFEFFVPSTSSAMLRNLLGGVSVTDTFLATTPWAVGSSISGTTGGAIIEAPIAIINDTKDRTILIPNAKLVTSLSMVDKVSGIQVSVMAQDIDTETLKTVMFIDGSAQYEV